MKDDIKRAAFESKPSCNIVKAALFWGSLWGIAEATLGHVIHVSLPLSGAAGLILFPIGFYFMKQALRSGGRVSVIPASALVAASIKLLDLFIPGVNPIFAINPAVSIALEGLAVATGVYWFTKSGNAQRRPLQHFREILGVSFSWRAAFIIYSFGLSLFQVSPLIIQAGARIMAVFLVAEPLINALLIRWVQNLRLRLGAFSLPGETIKPVWSVFALTGAVLLHFLL